MRKFTTSIVATAFLATIGQAEDLNVQQQIDALKKEVEKLKSHPSVSAKVKKLKFTGVHYLGLTSTDYDDDDKDTENKFETRRNYFEVKAYFKDKPKSYMRFTYDTHQDKEGEWNVRLKYAYLYLDNVLPNTGVEFGQGHRPWIDYEEHHGWLNRAIYKVFVESSAGAHLTNSADLGINFKTKTDYFSSEVGVFNGEGYHEKDTEGEKDLSYEWRFTAHPFGTGKKHVHATKDRYLDISFFGQINQDHTYGVSLSDYKSAKASGTVNLDSLETDHDLTWFGGQVIYNQPNFLVSAQYIVSDNDDYKKQGEGFSVNGEFRFGNSYKYSAIARYDTWDADDDEAGSVDSISDDGKAKISLDKNGDKDMFLVGMGYKYSKNVKFFANIVNVTYDNVDDKDYSQYMLSAEVKW